MNFNQHKKWAIPPLLLAAAWWAGSSEITAPPPAAIARPAIRTAGDFGQSPAVDRAAAPAVASATTPIEDSEEEQTPATILSRLVAEMDVAELRDHLRDFVGADLRGEAGHLLVRRWVEWDPPAAVHWVAQLDDAAARRELSSAAALAWSERDSMAALAWALSLPPGEISERVSNDLGFELARTDPVLSLNLAAGLPEGDARQALELHAARQWAVLDSQAAKDWAANLSSGNRREEALAAVTLAIASEDGAGAARFLLEKMSVGPESYRAVIGVVQRWAQTDYPAARKWVERFPATPLRETALAALAERMPARAN